MHSNDVIVLEEGIHRDRGYENKKWDSQLDRKSVAVSLHSMGISKSFPQSRARWAFPQGWCELWSVFTPHCRTTGGVQAETKANGASSVQAFPGALWAVWQCSPVRVSSPKPTASSKWACPGRGPAKTPACSLPTLLIYMLRSCPED